MDNPAKERKEKLRQEKQRSDIPWIYETQDHGKLKRNADPTKNLAIFILQEQMVETKGWKKLAEIGDQDICKVYWIQRKTPKYLIAGRNKLTSKRYTR